MLDKSKVNIPERFRDHPLFNTLHCGMNLGFMAKRGYYRSKELLAQPARMAKAGVNWTTLNANFCQEHFYSRKLFLDFNYSSGELELAEMAKALHDQGIRILFKPCLTSLDSAWMGMVSFPDGQEQIQGVKSAYWDEWFRGFTESAKYFADFAERIGIDALIVGAEYRGTEGRSDNWRKVIAEVRQIYSGPLTYEFTCDSLHESLDWFKDLDFLSFSTYPPACASNREGGFWLVKGAGAPVPRENPEYTVDQMVEYLGPQKKISASICKRFDDKPIAFTELGGRSMHGCIINPCNFQWETYYDGEEQANYMEAIFRTFWDLPQWMGLYWWKWDETQNRPQYHTDPKGDMGFTIQGKPAEKVMREWFAKNAR